MQIEVHCHLDSHRRAEWRDFLADAKYQHPRQQLEFSESERASGYEVNYVIARIDGAIRGVGIFCLKKLPFVPGLFSEAFCLSGPVCDEATDMTALLKLLCSHPKFSKVGIVKITPYWTGKAAEELGGALKLSGWTVSDSEPFRRTGWIDLKPEPDEIFASFSKSARREVRRAKRQGVEICRVKDYTKALEFLESLNRLRRSRGLPEVSQESFCASFRDVYCLGTMGALFAAYQDNVFIGGLLVHRSKVIAHTPHFTTEPLQLRALNNLRLAPLLWLAGLEWARQGGCVALDVEGWEKAPDPNDKKYNIYKYKGEFSPSPVVRIPEHCFTIHWLGNLTKLSGFLRAIAPF